MAGGSKGFRVDPDALDQVAERIADLRSEFTGEGGNYAGSQAKFQADANPSHMSAAWNSLIPNAKSVMTEPYQAEFTGLTQKYTAIATQLQHLEDACRSTAAEYRNRDDDLTANINQVDPGAVSPSGMA